jgi:3-hydroxyacyl-CoA dehydrogenase/enoyl-CoA hydratase/3-hydroxybutyryl-CoA epimerase
VGILGAGMMGAGIAWSSAVVGISVVLKDVSLEAAEKGKQYSAKLAQGMVEKGRMTAEQASALLDLIQPTTNAADLAGCDLVVEAVFEDRELKARVTQEAEAYLAETAIFASNTSTLPITGLAKASARPQQFIGLHFFSPVDKMQLVEIILGEETSDAALALSLDYIQQLKKVPIVVRDSRGFYTSRIFKSFVTEGLEMLAEGVKPALIENAGKMAGMPVGPLAVADEVSIGLLYHIFKQAQKDGIETEGEWHKVVSWMMEEEKREGKKAGKGFYDYPEGGKKVLWKGLAEHFGTAQPQPNVEELKMRFLHLQAVESYRCWDEGVLFGPEDGDIGSILGWGFPPYTGGTLSYIDFVGLPKFVENLKVLAQKFGARFTPPSSLVERAAQNQPIFENETIAII